MPPRKLKITKEKKPVSLPEEKKERYIESVGRRKTAVARVRIYPTGSKTKKHEILVNNKLFSEYFPLKREQRAVTAPFVIADIDLRTSVKVSGGGLNAQAEAIRLGIARALVAHKPELRTKLKGYGFLKRDPRMVERKKYGSRKARRPQQWRKR